MNDNNFIVKNFDFNHNLYYSLMLGAGKQEQKKLYYKILLKNEKYDKLEYSKKYINALLI